MASGEERGFLKSIKENPADVASRLAYADWLEDQGRPQDALKQRVKAGVSQLCYKVRRKSDGLFSDCDESEVSWSDKGKQWSKVGHVRGHFSRQRRMDPRRYGGDTKWDDLEVVLFEVRIQPVAVHRVSLEDHPSYEGVKTVVIHESNNSGESAP